MSMPGLVFVGILSQADMKWFCAVWNKKSLARPHQHMKIMTHYADMFAAWILIYFRTLFGAYFGKHSRSDICTGKFHVAYFLTNICLRQLWSRMTQGACERAIWQVACDEARDYMHRGHTLKIEVSKIPPEVPVEGSKIITTMILEL